MIETIKLLIALSGLINTLLERLISKAKQEQDEAMRSAIEEAKLATTRDEKRNAALKIEELFAKR